MVRSHRKRPWSKCGSGGGIRFQEMGKNGEIIELLTGRMPISACLVMSRIIDQIFSLTKFKKSFLYLLKKASDVGSRPASWIEPSNPSLTGVVFSSKSCLHGCDDAA
jgi:hypothetical protein